MIQVVEHLCSKHEALSATKKLQKFIFSSVSEVSAHSLLAHLFGPVVRQNIMAVDVWCSKAAHLLASGDMGERRKEVRVLISLLR
jgi:hypothetical protein